jgi:hypothetical protein
MRPPQRSRLPWKLNRVQLWFLAQLGAWGSTAQRPLYHELNFAFSFASLIEIANPLDGVYTVPKTPSKSKRPAPTSARYLSVEPGEKRRLAIFNFYFHFFGSAVENPFPWSRFLTLRNYRAAKSKAVLDLEKRFFDLIYTSGSASEFRAQDTGPALLTHEQSDEVLYDAMGMLVDHMNDNVLKMRDDIKSTLAELATRGWRMGPTELLQKILLLTANVDSLKTDVQSIKAMLLDHHERIIKLENSSDLIAEKAKNAALGAVTAVTSQLVREIALLEAKFSALPPPKDK